MGKAYVWIGSGETNPTIRYVCGFCTPDPIVVLKRGNTLDCVVPVMEAERARRANYKATVWTPASLQKEGESLRSPSDWLAALLEKRELNTIFVEPGFPLGVERRLAAKGCRVEIDETIGKERQRKSPSEIESIATSQRAMVLAMKQAVRVLKGATIGKGGRLVADGKPLTAEALKLGISRVLLEQGCMSTGVIAAPGRQGADPHETGSGPIRAGEPVVIDIFGKHEQTGYWGDLTRTLLKGQAPVPVAEMYKAVKAAHRAALNTVRAGVMVSTVHEAACETLERHGFKTDMSARPPKGFIHGTGHGVGLEIHEFPSVGMRKVRLREGHVITIEPGLYDYDLGGIRIEDTVVVTKTGYRLLAVCPYVFEL